MTVTLLRPPAPRYRRISQRRYAAGIAAIVIFGALCTGYLARSLLASRPVFWSSVQVRFLPPTSSANPNNLQITLGSIIMTANAVREMIDDSDKAQPSSPDVTIVDQGVHDGWSVTLPNSGGQYQTVYLDPYLVVQTAGPTPAVVTGRMFGLLDRIDADLARLQDLQHVPRSVRVQTARSTSKPLVYEVHGSRTRAAAGCLLLGVAGTWAMLRLHARRIRRLGRLRPAHARAEPVDGP